LSARYLNSPNLRLSFHRSRIGTALYLALCSSIACALLLLYLQGYLLLLSLFGPLTVMVLWPSRREYIDGAELCWSRGVWSVEREEGYKVVGVHARSTALPWVIYLKLVALPQGRNHSIWLFNDSAQQEQLRQLRVRLSLHVGEPSGGGRSQAHSP
jgi:hypothetical protein